SSYFYLHHRISLDDDIGKKYDIGSYRKTKKQDEPFSVCLNSLDAELLKRQKTTNDFDVIIIDETRSVMKQTDMKDSDGDKIARSTARLLDIFTNFEGKLFCLDANLSNEDINLILEYRKSSPFEKVQNPKYIVIDPMPAEPEFHMNLELIDNPRKIQYSSCFQKLLD